MSNNERQPITRRDFLIGAVSFALGVGGMMLKEAMEKNSTTFPPPPENPPLLKPSKEASAFPESRKLQLELLTKYLAIKKNYETIMEQPLSLEERRLGSLPTAKEINQMARQHLLDGTSLVRLILPPEQEVKMRIEPNQQKITLHNREFNLNNSLHFHLLAAVVELELDSHRAELTTQELLEKLSQLPPENRLLAERVKREIKQNQTHKEENQQSIKDLLWLLDENPPTTINEDAFVFLPTNRLIYHSQIFQILKRSDLPLPREVRYIKKPKDSPGAGWYNDHNHPSSSFTINITNHSGVTSIFHEVGHFISDASYLDPHNPKLKRVSQTEYERQIKLSLEEHGQKVKDKSNLFVVYPQPPSLVEDFAATFEEFFQRGGEFRGRLRFLRESDPAAFRILETKYKFMQEAFAGLEFTETGEILTRKYKLNSIVFVSDEDKEDVGILLRQNLNDILDPSLPAVFNGTVVEILEGPAITKDWQGKERTYWKVKIRLESAKGQRLLGSTTWGKEGWIPEEFLGEPIKNKVTS